MAKIVFTGGSITSGYGWNGIEVSLDNEYVEKDKASPYLWVNLLHKNVDEFKQCELHNLGSPGEANSTIFKQTVQAISKLDNIKYIFCSWVSAPRYVFDVGFELYETREVWHPADGPDKDRNLNNLFLSRKYLNDIKNRFLTLHHLHYEILKIVEYVNIINDLCKLHNINVYHINDSCIWDDNYFTRLNITKPTEFTEFTRSEIINISGRDDNEIYWLYQKMHDDYNNAGSICSDSWINLYDSFLSNQTDFNNDNIHPGKESNISYFNKVKNFLALKNIH